MQNTETVPIRHPRHWHHVYKRTRKLKNISSREIIVGQIIAMCGSLAAGYLLELNKQQLSLFAGAFLLLPGVIDLAASITGAMCAKVNHRLEAGGKTKQVLEGSVAFALLMSAASGLVVGVCGGVIGTVFFHSNFWEICLLSVITMMAVGLIAYPAMALLTAFIRKTGADPDNIIGPLETGFTDALTVVAIAVIVRLLV